MGSCVVAGEGTTKKKTTKYTFIYIYIYIYKYKVEVPESGQQSCCKGLKQGSFFPAVLLNGYLLRVRGMGGG